MPAARRRSTHLLPDGTPLRNRILAALPRAEYDRILPYLRMSTVAVGDTLQAHRVRIKDVYFPNGGVFSITNPMRNGALVEVATVGCEGMLGSAFSSATATELVARSSRWPMAGCRR